MKNFIFLVFCLTGCAKHIEQNDQCLSESVDPVIKAEGPDSARVNETIDLFITYRCYNGCGFFKTFEEAKNENTTVINLISSYNDCTICTQDLPLRQTIYKFKSLEKGIHILKFFKIEQTYLIDTIVVY